MLIKGNILQELSKDAGETKRLKAISYKNAGKVKFSKIKYKDKDNFTINAKVIGNEVYETYIDVHDGEIEDIKCNCPDYYNTYGVCKHSLATLMAFSEENLQRIEYEENNPINLIGKNKYIGFKQIVKTIYNEELEEINTEVDSEIKYEGTIRLEPKIIYDKFTKNLKLEFKIGNKRMYKIKNLSEFYNRMISREYYKYGEKLQFIHKESNFQKDSQQLLEFLMKYAEIIKYTNANAYSNYTYYGNPLNESYISLNNTSIDELFDILKGKKVEFQKEHNTIDIKFIEENPQIQFELQKTNGNEYVIVPKFQIYESDIIKGKNYIYILQNEQFYRCTKKFENENLKLLKIFRDNYLSHVEFGKEQLNELFSVIMPKVKDAIKMNEDIKKEIEEYIPEKLAVKIFLDFDKNNYVVSNVKFCYGENEFNPLDEEKEKNFKYPRNIVEETKALNIFKRTGFMYETQNKRFILPENDKIYKFLTEDIEIYMQKFEVMATNNFKSKQIIKPKMVSLGVKVENNLLSVNLSQLNIDSAELEEVMTKYKLKKKYYRLKNGAFLELQDNSEINFLDQLISGTDIDYKELQSGNIKLPINRTLYLNQLLKNIKGTEIEKNKEYRDIVNNFNENSLGEDEQIPQKFENILRPYQKIGFKWLRMLDFYKFGGILADDMGLGKTIQIISILLKFKEEGNKRSSLVIAPSSLVLNWRNEVEKFAPELNIKVVRGNIKDRKEIIEELEKYDLIVTSYDLLKKDIELYKSKDYEFKYIIADEAQYLKNNNTQNAKSIKQIKASARFALTGTPIENSLSELWSIFDFIMPGYLFNYSKFKSTYETKIVKENDLETMKKLKILIEPFILRRTKKEVLTELPEKTVTVLNNEMGEEQKNIYLSYLLKAKQELKEDIDINGYEKSQIKILAALTRLRQICCHPSLFIDNYKSTSSKLEQCMEIIEDGITAGHKILLFSSYTSMFEIMEKELIKRQIKYFKLTGSTKVDERIDLVEEFNHNEDVKIFLISLKAGGTGLNLTGADMVIHYDPWWNISAENQATDRAYRIGQKNNVQVYKFITKDSIEEKIYELQQKKYELTENMLNTNTTFINKLSKDEIMNLFK